MDKNNNHLIRNIVIVLIIVFLLIGGGVYIFLKGNKTYFSEKDDNVLDKLSSLPEYESASNSFEIIKKHQKDTSNFTEGLFIYDGKLYESTGKYGESKLLSGLDLENRDYVKCFDYPDEIFAEGSTLLNNKIYCLTYKENIIYSFDLDKNNINEKQYPYEGWGLTTNGVDTLYSSDGSSNIYKFNEKIELQGTIQCKTSDGHSIPNINELEYVYGKIYANVFMTNCVIRIDAESGLIEKIYDFTDLIDEKHEDENSVLNGIAYNSDKDTFLLTGKNYEFYYELKLK